MGSRVVAIDAAAQDGDGCAPALERAAMRLAVDAAGEAAHDKEPGRSELAPEHPRDRAAVCRACPRPDHGDGRARKEPDLCLAAHAP